MTMRKLQILNKSLMDETSAKAKTSPRLRMNYNFHPELSDKVQRFINAWSQVLLLTSTTIKLMK